MPVSLLLTWHGDKPAPSLSIAVCAPLTASSLRRLTRHAGLPSARQCMYPKMNYVEEAH